MSFISRHKFATFTVVMFLILIVLGVALFRFLVPNYELDEYGNRCDKSNKYKIEESKINEMKDSIKENENVNSIDYLSQCSLIDVTINIKDEMEKDAAKELAKQVVTYFSEDQKGVYDIQITIISDNDESEKYPIMGTKHKTRVEDTLVWSNN